MKAGEVVADRYRLGARLGIGGMGEVWRATHTGTGRDFALKFMHAHAATSMPARQRFIREARVSAKINHPNVIDIFDVGEVEDGVLFLAMELLEGVSLAEALHQEPPLSVQELLTICIDTARALAAAHAVGVVHRDVKPGNIFLHKDKATGYAVAKILDFGISKAFGVDDSHHTKTGAVLGSPRYMSPEQTRSASDVDHRADLWSMGVILFEGLTGTWPHEGDSFSSLVVAICTVPPLSIDLMVPGLPESVRSIVRGCLRPVEQRIQSADELVERLAAALANPLFAQLPLPRPLHPPSEGAKSTTGVRIRPPLLTTTGSGVRFTGVSSADAGADSMRATRQRLDASTPPRSQWDDDDATRVRPSLMESTPGVPSSHPVATTAPLHREVSAVLGAPAAVLQSYSGLSPAPYPPAAESSGILPAPSPPPVAGPAYKQQVRTLPIQAAAHLQAELARAGAVPFPGQAEPLAVPPSASPAAAPARALRLIAAALGLLLVVLAAVAAVVLRSPSAPAEAVGSASAVPAAVSASAAPASAVPVSAVPASAVPASAAPASAAPASAAPASAAPAAPEPAPPAAAPERAKTPSPARGPGRGPPGKIKSLGSGL
jgi:serine/threonine-protein kinase